MTNCFPLLEGSKQGLNIIPSIFHHGLKMPEPYQYIYLTPFKSENCLDMEHSKITFPSDFQNCQKLFNLIKWESSCYLKIEQLLKMARDKMGDNTFCKFTSQVCHCFNTLKGARFLRQGPFVFHHITKVCQKTFNQF